MWERCSGQGTYKLYFSDYVTCISLILKMYFSDYPHHAIIPIERVWERCSGQGTARPSQSKSLSWGRLLSLGVSQPEHNWTSH